ncbi:hypothetical protein U0038_11825 [Sphingobacterium spiritivorum]|uniref:Uncharacterized protein n=1 Tax=Sphingobacterium spiritivorum ATCC 33861 TaxID=525373 RepID=D7VRL9_SPHSI|nr:hypothetical protein [Sphingobacterium spiritivorum]EFK56420.1 hypothetical protein HMPREF0766_13623 [Sphingobacterium spiritivorum ATCC 33861]QQT35507.1 hypothetical protein I6J01_19875 [Sphingobacterium spiritivorum]WQD32198.1 hypothetical protein U0038_11825 [Sphingobacterium spiritivorum]SUJ06619.1 Uncharacterised protein [Sphingobacterium spiritivorum]
MYYVKKYLFTCILLTVVSLGFSQQTKQNHKQKEEYCMIIPFEKLLSNLLEIAIDTGAGFDKDARKLLMNPKTNTTKFKSVIEGINVMAELGWTVVFSAPIVSEGDPNRRYYLLKREMDSNKVNNNENPDTEK